VSPALQATAIIDRRPWSPNFFVAWPTYKLNFDNEVADSASNELTVEQAVAGISGLINDVAGAARVSPSSQREIAAVFARVYDPQAAEAISAGTPVDPKRVALLSSFAKAEQQFVVKQTEALVTRMASDEWISSFRTARDKEQSQLTKAKVVGWAGIIAAGAIGVPGVTLAISEAMDATYTNWATSMETTFVEIRQMQLAVNFEAVGVEESITATSLDELRRKLKALYESRLIAAR
jgi:hypothetical protein